MVILQAIDRDFTVQQLRKYFLTHVIYGFAHVDQSGGIVLPKQLADIKRLYPSDPSVEDGNNVYGCVKQLFLLKKANRNLKTLLSIGGYDPDSQAVTNFANLTRDDARQVFVKSAIQMIRDFGSDGIDIAPLAVRLRKTKIIAPSLWLYSGDQ
jgi:chitinase